MRKRRVWRYYCDFCDKGTCRPLMKHEEHCTKNPNRRCRMCHWAKFKTKPMTELIAAALTGVEKLREATQGCPACMLAAIRQSTASCEFDYPVEREAFWASLKQRWEKETENQILSEMYGDVR